MIAICTEVKCLLKIPCLVIHLLHSKEGVVFFLLMSPNWFIITLTLFSFPHIHSDAPAHTILNVAKVHTILAWGSVEQ